jgi:hypothetical protein
MIAEDETLEGRAVGRGSRQLAEQLADGGERDRLDRFEPDYPDHLIDRGVL